MPAESHTETIGCRVAFATSPGFALSSQSATDTVSCGAASVRNFNGFQILRSTPRPALPAQSARPIFQFTAPRGQTTERNHGDAEIFVRFNCDSTESSERLQDMRRCREKLQQERAEAANKSLGAVGFGCGEWGLDCGVGGGDYGSRLCRRFMRVLCVPSSALDNFSQFHYESLFVRF